MASAEGLVRFDGLNFKKFYHDPEDPTTIDNNPVTNILPHSNGLIYVCTDGYGLSIYDPVTNVFSKPGFQKDGELTDKPLNSAELIEDKRNRVWIIDKQRVYVYDPKADSLWTPECFDPKNLGLESEVSVSYFGCQVDDTDSNILWIASLRGLLEYHIDGDSLSIWSEKLKDPTLDRNISIRHINQNHSDFLYLATEASGVVYFDKVNKVFQDFETDYKKVNIWASAIVERNKLWIGGTNKLSSYDLFTQKFTDIELNDSRHYKFSYGDIRIIYKDSNNIIWMGRNSGLTKFSLSSNKFNSYIMDESKAYDFVKTAFYDRENNTSYAASKAGVLVFENNDYSTITKVIHAPKTLFFPRSVRKYKNYYYTISNNRVWRFKSDSDSLELFAKTRIPTTNGFEIDSKGNMWVFAWHKDMIRFNIESREAEEISFPEFKQSHIYKQMLIDSSDNIYLGVDNGLMKWSTMSDTLSYSVFEKSNDGYSLRNIVGVTYDLDGNIVFASDSDGVFNFNMVTGDIYRISDLTNANNLGVDSSGYIWANTDNAVYRIDRNTGDYQSFNILDGLPVQDFEMVGISTINNNEVFLGCNSRYSIIQDNTAFNGSHIFDSYITSIEVNGYPWSNGGNILYQEKVELSNEENYLKFGFVSMDFGKVDRNKFKYKLEGYDKNWSSETSDNFATYTRIPPGDYTFKVINSNNDRGWNDNPDTLEVLIKPAWYETLWFKLILAIAFGYTAWKIYNIRATQIAKQAKLKADFDLKISELEMKSLKAQMNPHFVFNSLNSIKHYALTKSEKETALFINDFSSLIRRIFENSKHKTISIEDEMKMLELYIAIEKRRLGDKFEYEISVDESIDQYDTDIPAMILQPHIENAIWHGLMHKESNGVLKLEIKDQKDSILCRISDNGIGRKRSSQIQNQNRDNFRKSSGTNLTTERIELINKIFDREASISIEDRITEDGKPAGTTIEVILPKIF